MSRLFHDVCQLFQVSDKEVVVDGHFEMLCESEWLLWQFLICRVQFFLRRNELSWWNGFTPRLLYAFSALHASDQYVIREGIVFICHFYRVALQDVRSLTAIIGALATWCWVRIPVQIKESGNGIPSNKVPTQVTTATVMHTKRKLELHFNNIIRVRKMPSHFYIA